MKTKIIILFAFGFVGMNCLAQTHEVPTPPFLDSSNYIPPPPLKKVVSKKNKHSCNNKIKVVTKKTYIKRSPSKKTLKNDSILKENKKK